MNTKTRKIVLTALVAALTCVATMIIKIPSPLKGYVNLGDCMVLTAGWLLTAPYGFAAAAIGSALADVLSGYLIYAPATFLIKGIMALIAFYLYKISNKKTGNILAQIISGIMAETLMVFGYFVFEGFLYGFIPSLVNIPANAVQGVFGIVIGMLVIRVFEKVKA